MSDDALPAFHPLVAAWFRDRFGSPTEIQRRAWPVIARGRHVLITAPTGSGKTLTAFLWAVNRLVEAPDGDRPSRVLYISPLKALNNDIRRNLEQPLAELRERFASAGQAFPEVRVAVRSGDTDPSERRRMLRSPPDIFITTPESLNILLTSRTGRRALQGFAAVILDEIHSVAPTKRGTYLMSAVERLVPLCGEFQRIALSATVRPLDTVADFIGGRIRTPFEGAYRYDQRPVEILASAQTKACEIGVRFPEGAGETNRSEAWWTALVEDFRGLIDRNRSTLFFTNSRRMTEKVARLVNEREARDRIYSHHGSLSREIRSVVEKRLKAGELEAIVATSSLELGIDIGTVDEVVLVQIPFSVASAVQRIGRSGHGVGETARGTFCPLHDRAFLDAAVLAAQVDAQNIESIRPVEAPLDVLAQVVLSMVASEARPLDEVYAEVRTSWPFRSLGRREFDLVVDMLAGRYAEARLRELKPRVILDRQARTIRGRQGTPALLYLSGGVIPDRGYYDLRLADSKAKIGELDEEFVWERSVGEAFPLGNQIWRIQRISHNDVEVAPAPRATTVIPFWRAEEVDRTFHFAEQIGRFLERAEHELGTNAFRARLLGRHHMSPAAADHLVSYLERQRAATGSALPHRHHLLVEHFRDPVNAGGSKQTVLHTLWGGQVNRPLALALAGAWEDRYGYPLQTYVDNDCILLNLPHAFHGPDLLELVPPGRLTELLRRKLESTGYFGARFRENAQRALLLPRRRFRERMPLWLNRLRARKLLDAVSRFEDFPILLETWRGCLNDAFDLPCLVRLLEELHSGETRLTEVQTRAPSPFAQGVIWTQTDTFMYERDTPSSRLRTNLSDELLQEVVHTARLRPRLSDALIRGFEQKAQRLAEGYAPAGPDELLVWVKERRFIPEGEWRSLLAAVERDHGLSEVAALDPVRDRIAWIRPGRTVGVVAAEDLDRTERALGLRDPGGLTAEGGGEREEPEDDDGSEALLAGLLGEWLRFYGPVSRAFVRETLGLTADRLAHALEDLLADRTVLVDTFREKGPDGGTGEEICDSENLEILLRLRRAAQRPAFAPLDPATLPLFLAAHQGLTGRGEGIEDLQRRLEQLFGYPARARLWETEILPARLTPYHGSWLDAAMNPTDLAWFGCGRERVGFCFETDYELFAEEGRPADVGTPVEASPDAAVLRGVFSTLAGRIGLADLAALPVLEGMPTDRIAGALWELAWAGEITNDSFEAVRNGLRNRFRPEPLPRRPGSARRRGLNRWQSTRPFAGAWRRLPSVGADSLDALDREGLTRDRIRQLFARYGVLFRELLWNELPALRWAEVFRALRLMELSGEVFTGHFFRGVRGLQFCTHEAFRVLRRPLPDDAVYWMCAADPASLCGIDVDALKAALPPRLPTTHLVFHGRKAVLVSSRNGRSVDVRVPPDSPHLPEYLGLFKELVGREVDPLKNVRVETLNDLPAPESPYAPALLSFGFQRDYRSLTLWKRF